MAGDASAKSAAHHHIRIWPDCIPCPADGPQRPAIDGYNTGCRRVETMRLIVEMEGDGGSGCYFVGSNMHCNAGLAILVKVALIWDCFDGGTQSVSMVGTPVSLMPRSRACAGRCRRWWLPRSRANSRKRISGCAQRPTIWGVQRRTNSSRGSENLIDRTSACAEPARTMQTTIATAPIRKDMNAYRQISRFCECGLARRHNDRFGR